MFQAERALADLADDPEQLDRARRRFSASPPFYKSPTPGSTLSNSPNPPSPGEIQRDREHQEHILRQSSRPRSQFVQSMVEEKDWLFKAQANAGVHLPAGTEYNKLATEVVKKRWQEQGIWDDEWDKLDWDAWRWKHEESYTDLSSQEGTESEPHRLFEHPASSQAPVASVDSQTILQKKDRGSMSEPDRETSRPIYQFIWQLARQRDLIRGEPTIQAAAASAPIDINTRAYEAVKSTWVRQNIWDKDWGIMPGMTWMHERSPDQTIRLDPTPAHARHNSFAIVELEAEARRLFPKPPPPPKLPDLPPFVDKWGLFGNLGDMNSTTGDTKSPKNASPAPSNISPLVPDEAMSPTNAAVKIKLHSNDISQVLVDSHKEPQEDSKNANTPRDLLRPSESSSKTSRLLRGRGKNPTAFQQKQTRVDQPHSDVQISDINKLRTKDVLPNNHSQPAAVHSPNNRSSIDLTIENDHSEGRRRSKRLRHEITKNKHVNDPTTSDPHLPLAKTAKRRKPNTGAEKAIAAKADAAAIAESRRSNRQEEQKSNDVRTRLTRATAKSRGITTTKPAGRKKAKRSHLMLEYLLSGYPQRLPLSMFMSFS
ncbi:MAG: hypothetical protein Q9221_007722 [Calogaya cf. arnoldii]